jgi:hypothetical protein
MTKYRYTFDTWNEGSQAWQQTAWASGEDVKMVAGSMRVTADSIDPPQSLGDAWEELKRTFTDAFGELKPGQVSHMQFDLRDTTDGTTGYKEETERLRGERAAGRGSVFRQPLLQDPHA